MPLITRDDRVNRRVAGTTPSDDEDGSGQGRSGERAASSRSVHASERARPSPARANQERPATGLQADKDFFDDLSGEP